MADDSHNDAESDRGRVVGSERRELEYLAREPGTTMLQARELTYKLENGRGMPELEVTKLA